jgi:hypothetical protein
MTAASTLPSPSTPIQQIPVEAPVDFETMLLLWNSEDERKRRMALEMADRNRVNARSEK